MSDFARDNNVTNSSVRELALFLLKMVEELREAEANAFGKKEREDAVSEQLLGDLHT